MVLLRNDQLTQLAFSIHENKGVFAVLLGSGLSRSADIPTGWEITLDLIRRIALTQGIEEQSDWAEWYRKTTKTEPNYSTLLEEIAILPSERRSILHSYIEPNKEERTEGKKVPTPAHLAIAKLVSSGHIRVIITTNFDRLMENALREKGIEPTVISTLDSLKGAEPLIHSKCYLLKVHGDYKDDRILNTDRELEAYPDELNNALDRIIDEHGIIVCGWSGEWDHALRNAFFRSPNRRYPTFWTVKGILSERGQKLANHRKANIVQIDNADDFFNTLQFRINVLEKSQQINPLDIDVIINSTKKFLSEDRYKIQLNDLILSESQHFLKKITNDKYSTQLKFSKDFFNEQVNNYDLDTETLGRIMGVLGRWGNDCNFELATDVISNAYTHCYRNNIDIKELKVYPSILLFTAYAIGLVSAKRWRTLHNLFMYKLPANHDGKKDNIVSRFFLRNCAGSINIWNNIKDSNGTTNPFSNHVFHVINRWKTSFMNDFIEFNFIYDKYEMLGSLAFHECVIDSKGDLSSYLTTKAFYPDENIRVPVGRVAWNDSAYNELMSELNDPILSENLLKHGFSKGNPSILNLFKNDFTSTIDKINFS